MLMLTTPEEPISMVGQLRHRIPRNTGVLVGHYRLWNNCVTLLVQRQDRRNTKLRARRKDGEYVDFGEQTFHMVRSIYKKIRFKFKV